MKINIVETKFCIGQCVFNTQFDYRGVIIDVDSVYRGTAVWYKKNAPHRPSKKQPWYHILVHNAVYRVYSDESALMLDTSGESINHPDVDYFFLEFKNGLYLLHAAYKT